MINGVWDREKASVSRISPGNRKTTQIPSGWVRQTNSFRTATQRKKIP
jgi:hypothetical protein